ncbi:hypothetical protein N7452_011324 [Penicillium brevicompactum]|uniref:Uncharacterized protein n=1 Tax=Penicillium brevicompactum TaxID=5074 RepID=A0A9W9Q1Z2_PENBR|nr:hypothetical protein N7452_011324 [Penicillium brevicompactum]
MIFLRRLLLTGLSLLGPEFIFQIAIAQWESARQSVADFRSLGIEWWTMRHGFYADMGGYVLKPKDSVEFPINAKQLHYLIEKGYVKDLKNDELLIKDKNKVDAMLRFITLCQSLWFIISICGRAWLQLAITTGELTTAAFIVCSVATTICWWHKPADVQTYEIIEMTETLQQILAEAGDQARVPYQYTPLDFISRKEWSWSIYWSNWVNILRKMHIVFYVKQRPVNRHQLTLVPEPSTLGYGLFIFLTAIYASLFICGWNYTFPTPAERYLWRFSSTAVLVCTFAFWAVGYFAFSIYPFYLQQWFEDRKRKPTFDEEAQPPNPTWAAFKERAKRVCDTIRNNSIDRDPSLTVPLKAILPIYVLGVVYGFSRSYIFIEDALEFRALPASAYSTLDWIDFFPHV